MSYTHVTNIGFNKKSEEFTLTGYCSNVFPKKAETIKIFKNKNTPVIEKVENIIYSILSGNFRLSLGIKSYFIRCYTHAIYDICQKSQEPVSEYIKRMTNFLYYSEWYDRPENKPTEKDKEDYKKLIRMTYDYLYMNIPEKYGKIQITNAPTKIVCKEVHNIYKNSYSYCTPGYGKKFSLTKAVLTVLKINKDAIFTELK